MTMTNTAYENSFLALAESLNQVLFTLDDLGKITYVSAGCTELLGFLPEEIIGRSISVFVTPGEKDRFCMMGEPARSGKNDPVLFHVVSKDGAIHPATAISRISPDDRGNTGMIGLIGESRSGKPAEKIIRQANTQIHELNSIIRHDINNQLTILNGYLSLMEQDSSMISSPELVTILLGAADKIFNLITFSKEYKDFGTRLPVWTNLGEVFRAAQSSQRAAGVQITTDPACQETEIFTDPMLITVFSQLIDNSLSHGKMVSAITLQVQRENGGATIVYRDNGTGIPDTVRPTLFHMGKGTKTGYGLFLVQEILAISGFTITEKGTPGKGVRFVIAVPAGSCRPAEQKPQ
jgi:PAS domain S-box-containing protein